MIVSPNFSKEYEAEDGSIYTLKTYFANEDEDTIVINSVASTKRKIYIKYPEFYIEIIYPSGSINAHHLADRKQFKIFLHNWSNVWGADFWKELITLNFI